MPMCCCVLGCQNKADRQKNISLFRFPRNKDILDSWISFVGRTNWQPTNTSRICSLHFNNDDYYRWNDRLFLKPGVLPRKCIVRMSDNKENFDPFKVLNDKLTVNSSKRAFEETLENAENFKLQAISTESFNEIEILKERLQHDRELHQQELKKQAEMFSVILENEKSKLKSEIKSGLELHQQELKRQAEIFSTILENEKSKFRSKIESGQQKLHTLQRSVKRKEEQIKSMKHLFDELKKKYRDFQFATSVKHQTFAFICKR
ncbi:THAP domain-containing protein 1-like isoform X2 [Solenopsis invicta]|uniref:THAP domain-containing protein 1-like isoform X2 n=1 Tax=Solenopsis invicta TaxID=13686 RepID=UPI00193D846D|nr:THAP domain-containing protein 1-like isoform X2 [Solenopsis invicta]XP_039315299.1 THAP domain-containing protein 1-like isoform X2 [Solenopsis invicta]